MSRVVVVFEHCGKPIERLCSLDVCNDAEEAEQVYQSRSGVGYLRRVGKNAQATSCVMIDMDSGLPLMRSTVWRYNDEIHYVNDSGVRDGGDPDGR